MVKIGLFSILLLFAACAPRNGNQSLLAGKSSPTVEDHAKARNMTIDEYLNSGGEYPIPDYSHLLNYEPEKPRASALDKLEKRQKEKPLYTSEHLTLNNVEQAYSYIRVTGAEAEKIFSGLKVKGTADKKDGLNISCQRRSGRPACAVWINQVMGLAVPNQRLMESVQTEEQTKETYKIILKDADAQILFSAMQAEPENGIKYGSNIRCSESECSLELSLNDGKALPLP